MTLRLFEDGKLYGEIYRRDKRNDFMVRPNMSGPSVVLLDSQNCDFRHGEIIEYTIEERIRHIGLTNKYCWDETNAKRDPLVVELLLTDICNHARCAGGVIAVGFWDETSFRELLNPDTRAVGRGRFGTFAYGRGVVGRNYFHVPGLRDVSGLLRPGVSAGRTLGVYLHATGCGRMTANTQPCALDYLEEQPQQISRLFLERRINELIGEWSSVPGRRPNCHLVARTPR